MKIKIGKTGQLNSGRALRPAEFLWLPQRRPEAWRAAQTGLNKYGDEWKAGPRTAILQPIWPFWDQKPGMARRARRSQGPLRGHLARDLVGALEQGVVDVLGAGDLGLDHAEVLGVGQALCLDRVGLGGGGHEGGRVLGAVEALGEALVGQALGRGRKGACENRADRMLPCGGLGGCVYVCVCRQQPVPSGGRLRQ